MTQTTRTASPPEYYWATEDDPEALASTLWTRTRRYFEGLERSVFWRASFRSWCYYHGLYFKKGEDFDWTAVSKLTPDGVLGAPVNELRAILELISQYVTQERPSIETRATRPDNSALLNARFGDQLIEHYLRDQDLEVRLKQAVIHALVLSEGFIYYPWDRYSGPRDFVPDLDETGSVVLDGRGKPKGWWVSKGDFVFCNPSIFDVVRDLGVKEWEKNRWVCVRTYENRWEIAKRAKDNASGKEGAERYDAILGVSVSSDAVEESFYRISLVGNSTPLTDDDTDMIPVWSFYHKPTDAIPEGRYLQFTVGGVPISDPEDFPYHDAKLPISRVTCSSVLMTQLGYSPANDLQAPQELLNAEVSTIATNHEGAGYNVIWVPEGSELEDAHLGQGVLVVRGGAMPPQGVSFTVDSEGHYKYTELLGTFMERISGMNSVVRGQPEASLRSGEALKVIESRAIQSTSNLAFSYVKAIEETSTFILRTLRQYMEDDEERAVSILGEGARWQLSEFTKENLKYIDCVRVDIANPVSKTISGKFEIANMLLKMGGVSTPEELITVLETGNLEPLLKADRAQLDLIHDENDKLLKGELLTAEILTDHHILHVKEHLAILNSVDARMNPELQQIVMAHTAQHVQALMRPEVISFQAMLGYRVPPMPIMAVPQPGGPGGGAGGGMAAGGMPMGGMPMVPPGVQPGESALPGEEFEEEEASFGP